MPSELEVYKHLVKIVHIFCGIYIWEFVTTLSFEWEVFSGKRPWRWSFAVYLLARIFGLVEVILQLIGYNVTEEMNCNAWFRCVLIAAWFSVAISSFLLVLRGVAIWGRDKVITSVAVTFWLINMCTAGWSSTEAHATWNAELSVCAVTGTSSFRWTILINLIVDLSLLCIMFVGVMQKKNATRLWRMLYFQGIFWIMTAICTEVPCVILPFMNMSNSWNLFFQVPHMVLMVIMSTRLYRDLLQYITNDQYLFEYRHSKASPHHNVQVAVHKTIEVDVDLRHLDEEQQHSAYMPTVSVRSQAEIDMIAAELQMKNDLHI